MTTHTGAPAPGLAPDDAGPVWHTLSADGVLRAEKVDEHSGLSSAEAAARAERFGLICLAVALSIVVVSEIQKAVRRHTARGQQETR